MAVDLCPREAPRSQGQLTEMAPLSLPTGSTFLPQDHSFYLKLLPGSRGLAEGLGEQD